MAGNSNTGNPSFTPTGQPWSENPLPPEQDAGGTIGTPMFQEDYDYDRDFEVQNTQLHGGRTVDEVYDGIRLLGYPIKSAGLADNKFLRFDESDQAWVIGDASGVTNMTDLADFNSGASQDVSEVPVWKGTYWDSEILTQSSFQKPLNGLVCGATSGEGKLQISSVENEVRALAFSLDDGTQSFTDKARIYMDDNDPDFTDGDKCLIFQAGSGEKVAVRDSGIMQFQGHSSEPNAKTGGIYYSHTTQSWYLGIEEEVANPS